MIHREFKKVDPESTLTIDDIHVFTKDNVTSLTVPEEKVRSELFREPPAGSYLKYVGRVDAAGMFR
jgi:hypothetical protein